MTENISAEQLKGLGNEAFKNGQNDISLDYYTKALELQPAESIKAALYKNRSMVKLKMEDFEGAEYDCSKVLETYPSEPKALYRRALAREHLNKLGLALEDAKKALTCQPNEKAINDLCKRLYLSYGQLHKKVQSTDFKVTEMLKLAFEGTSDKKISAMNNLLVLCRESQVGASGVWSNGTIVKCLMEVINNSIDWNDELALCAIRILDELAKQRERANKINELLTEPILVGLLSIRPPITNMEAASTLIQRCLNGLAAMDRNKEIKPDNEIVEKNKLQIHRIIAELEDILTDKKYSAQVREASLDLLLKNLMHMDGSLPRGWSWRFVENRGLFKVLHVACQIPEQCDYPVSIETRQHVSIFLTRLYDDMVFDKRRANYQEKVDQVFKGILTEINLTKNKIQLASLLITLLQGPVDTGISLVTNDQVTAIMLQMASSDDPLQQSVAVELIVLTVSKHERATAIIKNGLPVLQKLFKSSDQNVKVRALVGLCKCAAAGGDDCSKQTMTEEIVLKLANTCKQFLLAVDKYPVDIRRFACEGLSYLSLDADIKEFIVSDSQLLKALVSLAKSAGAICVFTLAAIYVNLCNAYEKPKVEEELVKLAQFAKHHVPETHPKDTDEYITQRTRKLVKDGAVVACIAISKTESKNALDNLARCMANFCAQQDLTGQIISEGGAKLLLSLHKECTPVGKIKAAHGLARLGVGADPNIAFPGQRKFEVVKPLVDLLHPEVEGLANYDALLTLTNLASIDDNVRRRIVKERAIPKIEEFWFDVTHEDLRAAAAELLLNMLYLDEFFKETIKEGNDRVKLWVLYCDEGNDRLKLSASAAFALLTAEESVCRRIIEEIKSWPEHFCELAMSENPEVQYRCLIGIANMVESCEKVASEIIGSEVFRVLVAITKLNDKEREKSQKQAQRALDAAEKYDIIKPTDRQLYEKKSKLSTVQEIV